jgi:hypothetical protein
MAFDPWAQTHAAQNNQASSMLSLAALKRQDQRYADEAEDRATSRKVANLNLATAQRGFDDQTTLRDALAAAKGGFTYPEPQGVGPMPQGQEGGLSNMAPQAQPASTMDRMKVAAGLASQGNTAAQAALPQMAQVIDLDDKMAQYQAEVEAGGGDRQAFLKQKAQFEQGKEMMKTIAPMAANPATRKMAERSLEWYKQQQPDNPHLQNMTVDDFNVENEGLVAVLKDPETGKVIGYNILDPYTNKSSFHAAPKEADTETWGEPYEGSVGGKKAMLQKSNRGQVRPVISDTSTTVVVKPGGAGHGGGAVPGGKILPAGQLESIADMKRVKDVMAEAQGLLKATKVDTGPVVGRLQSLGSKVGLASDDFVNVQQKMQTAENIMLKLRSGAAVTESEYQRFKKEFPRTSDSPEVRDRKMNNAINYATELMDSKMSIYEEGGYRVPQSVKSGGKTAAAQPKQGQTKKGGRFTIIEVK